MLNIRSALAVASLTLALGLVVPGRASKKDKDMSGMDMSHQPMPDMGPSMAAMMGHMIMTPQRPIQPGDEERARTVIAAAKTTMERYLDYRKALADGYVIANPKVEQIEYHFNNDANMQAAETHFDPSKPSALLYLRTPHQRYKLEGVMYTARVHEAQDELDRRVPLSLARWHQHTNFCAAPAGRVKEYFGAHPRFGMFGSINTQEACDAAHGNFHPFLFMWMVHVFPYEKDFQQIFSVNDDEPHVH